VLDGAVRHYWTGLWNPPKRVAICPLSRNFWSPHRTNLSAVPGNDLRVSVVIPTCNRSDRLIRLLSALAAQTMTEPFEVVVVDDHSQDDTLQRLRSQTVEGFSLEILASATNTGPAGARNRGWRAASGTRIAFVDDDCVPDPGWLAALTKALESSDIAIGRTKPPDDQLDRIGPFSSYLDIAHDRSFSTCNIAYTRDVLETMQGFDEASFIWPNGEDSDLGLRATKAGFRDHYVPDALVWHDVGASRFKAHFARIKRLDGIVALVARHPEARQNLNAGTFLRSIDKAVLITWAATSCLLLRPRRETRLLALIAVLLYVWQFDRAHYKARSIEEWAMAVPLGFVADSWAVVVMIRSSIRYRTLLL
jgi:GT2 family glycosyltransferase